MICSAIHSKETQPRKLTRADKARSDRNPTKSRPSLLGQLQHSLGNQAIQTRCKSLRIQPKLRVGAANDKYEKEADHVADQVLRMQNSEVPTLSAKPQIVQRKCGDCANGNNTCQECSNEEEQDLTIQPKEKLGHTFNAEPGLSINLNSIKHQGTPLSRSERNFFEPRFGADFSGVRIHSGRNASSLAENVNARAFTFGNNIAFGPGEFAPNNSKGRKLLAHELTHVVQQGRAHHPRIQRQVHPTCSVKTPENCATYGQWISGFSRLATFRSEDGIPRSQGGSPQRFRVIGDRAASRSPNASTADRAPTPVSKRFGDQFVDHPTDNWVRQNMPENLRQTAYQLPSDCADIMVILRHVYLSAHHRTETYRSWVVGDALGGAAQNRMRQVIRDIDTSQLPATVNPYSDNQGLPIRDFTRLEPLLHLGDQLVWDHHGNGLHRPRSGGHSQTIMNIGRDNSGRIDQLDLLQGNQPLFLQQAEDIIAQTNTTRSAAGRRPLPQRRQEAMRARGGPVRSAPGRRLEVGTMHRNKMQNTQLPQRPGSTSQPVQVWTWGDSDHTILKVAGPPRSHRRPPMQRLGGQRHRRISDWFRTLSRASLARLHGIFEAALHEMRALIDGGQSVSVQDATNLGHRAGNRLWLLARRAVSSLTNFGRRSGDLRRGDLGHRVHFDRLHRIRAMIRALGGIPPAVNQGNPQTAPNVRRTFTLVDTEFNVAARGGENIRFARNLRRGAELVKILVTGFDPFNTSNIRRPPRSGEWNPSGTAAMAMDGSSINLDRLNKVAIEGVVLPVSFAQFNQGIVERMVQEAGQDVDGVVTVSLDPNLAVTAPVRIEQFAVGVHGLVSLQPHRLFPVERPTRTGTQATPGGGPAIIESNADVSGIAQETAGRTRRGLPTIQQPSIGRDITLRFANTNDAQRALSALGLTQIASSNRVTISDVTAIRRIINTTQRVTNGRVPTPDIRFRAGGQRFQATLLSGPGGSFLSNEVSFRTQRELRNRGSQARSFHVHTPEGGRIPQSTRTPQERRTRLATLSNARNVANTLIATLRRMIRAIGQRILTRRQQQRSSSGGTP